MSKYWNHFFFVWCTAWGVWNVSQRRWGLAVPYFALAGLFLWFIHLDRKWKRWE